MINMRDGITPSLIYFIFFHIDAMADISSQIDPPNDRPYEYKNLGTWSSISAMDSFLSSYNHANAYNNGTNKLAIGNYAIVQDGTYNTMWMIAGFDIEHNQNAIDGTVYDNGYGILLLNVYYAGSISLFNFAYNSSNTLSGGYINSDMHKTSLPSVATCLQNVFGSHLAQRNVLLSSSVDGNYYSNAYTWTTAHVTLPSVYQLYGSGNTSYRNKYDTGEANYVIPLSKSSVFRSDKGGHDTATRNIYGRSSSTYYCYSEYLSAFVSGDEPKNRKVTASSAVFPLIYIR